MLHNHSYENRLGEGDLLLMDSGAEGFLPKPLNLVQLRQALERIVDAQGRQPAPPEPAPEPAPAPAPPPEPEVVSDEPEYDAEIAAMVDEAIAATDAEGRPPRWLRCSASRWPG